jgi:putative aminophosphonate oxidoreductase
VITPPWSPTGPRLLTHRSLWLQQVLGDDPGPPPEPLRGNVRADVCILGGGYTGLWTAIELKRREPDVDVVVLEADLCGGGASGRNGGFVLSWWAKLASLIKICGEEDALWVARKAEDAVSFIGEFCDDHGIDAEYRRGGWLWTATSPAQVGSWESTVASTEGLGVAAFQRLDPDEVRRRGGSAAYLAGVFEPSAATVQPARLARGLASVARERGVRIHEQTPARALTGRQPLVVETPSGHVTADVVVSALNAWTAGLAPLRRLARAFVPITSDMVASGPVPATLAATGWTGGECITDSRLLVHYHRTTADGRIAIGRGGGAIGAAGWFGTTFHYDRRRSEGVAASLHGLYPSFRDVPVTHAWSGPIDRSETGIPFFGRADGCPNLVYGLGFSGNGVGPCVLGGRILASLALHSDDRWSATALARGPFRRFPPEPVRFVGGSLVREAVRRKEALEDEGRAPGAVVSRLAALAPAGLFKVGPAVRASEGGGDRPA